MQFVNFLQFLQGNNFCEFQVAFLYTGHFLKKGWLYFPRRAFISSGVDPFLEGLTNKTPFKVSPFPLRYKETQEKLLPQNHKEHVNGNRNKNDGQSIH